MNDDNSPFNLIHAYALGALSAEERVQVEALLATSEEARTELRNYEEMLAAMSILVPARKARPELTDEFRKRLAAQGRGVAAPPVAPVKALPPSRRMTRVQWLVGIAALVAIVFGVFAVYQSGILDPEGREIRDIMNDPDAVWVTLDAQQPGVTGKVSFVTTHAGTHGVLVAELPPLPNDKQYQFWLLTDKAHHNGGVFSATQTAAQVLVNMPNPADFYQAVGLTVEPRGGSVDPTTSPIFVGKFAQ